MGLISPLKQNQHITHQKDLVIINNFDKPTTFYDNYRNLETYKVQKTN